MLSVIVFLIVERSEPDAGAAMRSQLRGMMGVHHHPKSLLGGGLEIAQLGENTVEILHAY